MLDNIPPWQFGARSLVILFLNPSFNFACEVFNFPHFYIDWKIVECFYCLVFMVSSSNLIHLILPCLPWESPISSTIRIRVIHSPYTPFFVHPFYVPQPSKYLFLTLTHYVYICLAFFLNLHIFTWSLNVCTTMSWFYHVYSSGISFILDIKIDLNININNFFFGFDRPR